MESTLTISAPRVSATRTEASVLPVADHRLVSGQGDRLLELHQPVEPTLDRGLGHLVIERRGRRPRADRVLERERGVEPGLPNDAKGLLEVRFGLPGESHDDVRGD